MTDQLLINVPAALETRRLSMRPPRPGDGEILLPAWLETIVDLRRFLSFLPWVAQEQTSETAESYCRSAHANFAARKDLPFFMFAHDSGKLVGCCGLHRPEWSLPKFEVGYWVRSPDAGQGYASEAVEALTSMALSVLRAARVELVTDEKNAPSRRVADRCQFELEGILRNAHRAPDGSLRNLCMYARLPESA